MMQFVDEYFGVICIETGDGELTERFTCLRQAANDKKVYYCVLLYFIVVNK